MRTWLSPVKPLVRRALLLPVWLMLAAPAWAQPAAANSAEEQKGWVLGYVLVLLCVGVGISVACRPSGRTSEVKPLEG